MGLSSSRFDPSKDLIDLHGKVAIVTGGNKGIGYYTVYHLVKAGATVYLGARDESRANAAIERVNADLHLDHDLSMDISGGSTARVPGKVVFLHMDLEDPRTVKEAALKVLENEKRLDIVVNNAAICSQPYQDTKEGISRTMVINHLGHFVLIQTLSPLLESTAREEGSDVRIVTVSSNGHLMCKSATFNSVEAFNTQYPSYMTTMAELRLYNHSKLANVLFSSELQRLYDAKNIPITCISLHPGAVWTDGMLGSMAAFRPQFVFQRLIRLLSYTSEEGSYTSLFAAASKEIHDNREKYRGTFLTPFDKIAEPNPLAKDVKLAKTLWETSETILKERFGLDISMDT